MQSATMVNERCCYGDDDHTRRRSRSVARARWSCVLVQSAEQRHQSRWHMKKEARTDEGARQRSLLRRAPHIGAMGSRSAGATRGGWSQVRAAGAKCSHD